MPMASGCKNGRPSQAILGWLATKCPTSTTSGKARIHHCKRRRRRSALRINCRSIDETPQSIISGWQHQKAADDRSHRHQEHRQGIAKGLACEISATIPQIASAALPTPQKSMSAQPALAAQQMANEHVSYSRLLLNNLHTEDLSPGGKSIEVEGSRGVSFCNTSIPETSLPNIVYPPFNLGTAE